MAKLDPMPLIEKLVTDLAAAADDQFEFASLLKLANGKVHEAFIAQMGQNADAMSEVLLEKRAEAAGVTLAALKTELAAELGRTPAAVKASELLDVVKIPQPAKP